MKKEDKAQEVEIQKRIDTLRETKNLEQLEFFKDPLVWDSLSSDKKEELAFFFLERAENNLNENTLQLQEDLDIAALFSPKNPSIFIRIGRLLLKQIKDKSQVVLAIQAFDKALALEDDHVPILKDKAHAFLELGILTEDSDALIKANETYELVQNILRDHGSDLDKESFYRWGVVLYLTSLASQEAVEMRMAIEKYQVAYAKGLDHPSFLIDYANALWDLGDLIGRIEMLFDAINLYEKALEEEENARATLSLACIYRVLFMHYNQEEYINKAEQYFIATARLNPQMMPLWLNWGRLLVYEGKYQRNQEILTEALDKFEKANALYPEEPLILYGWADALMHLGSIEDQFEYLKEAQEKISKAVSLLPSDPEVWGMYGHCLIHLGRYFGDATYFHNAIEKFKHASTNQNQQ